MGDAMTQEIKLKGQGCEFDDMENTCTHRYASVKFLGEDAMMVCVNCGKVIENISVAVCGTFPRNTKIKRDEIQAALDALEHAEELIYSEYGFSGKYLGQASTWPEGRETIRTVLTQELERAK